MLRLLLALALATPVAANARGAPPVDDDVAALRAEGKRALIDQRFDDAARAFAALLAQAEDRADRWQALNGLGLSHDLARRPAEAHTWFTRFLAAIAEQPTLADEAPWPARIAEVGAAVARLEATLRATHAALRVSSDPSGAELRIDGPGSALRDVTPYRGWLPPGRYEIRLAAPGRQPHDEVVELGVGDPHELDVTLAAVARDPPPTPPSADLRVVAPPPPAGAPVAGWVAVGAGAAALGTGVAFTALALDDHRELERLSGIPGTGSEHGITVKARMLGREVAYWICYGVGAAAVATGVVLLLDAASGDDATRAALVPLPGGAGAALHARF